jgi:type IV pilus assembly protein PilC
MNYEYIGYTADRQVVKGKIDASGEKEAGDKLAASGYQILKLKASGGSGITGMPALFTKGAKQEEIILFSRQLALLLESGVGIVQSLDLLKVQTTNKAFAAMLDTIYQTCGQAALFRYRWKSIPKHSTGCTAR